MVRNATGQILHDPTVMKLTHKNKERKSERFFHAIGPRLGTAFALGPLPSSGRVAAVAAVGPAGLRGEFRAVGVAINQQINACRDLVPALLSWIRN